MRLVWAGLGGARGAAGLGCGELGTGTAAARPEQGLMDLGVTWGPGPWVEVGSP